MNISILKLVFIFIFENDKYLERKKNINSFILKQKLNHTKIKLDKFNMYEGRLSFENIRIYIYN